MSSLRTQRIVAALDDHEWRSAREIMRRKVGAYPPTEVDMLLKRLEASGRVETRVGDEGLRQWRLVTGTDHTPAPTLSMSGEWSAKRKRDDGLCVQHRKADGAKRWWCSLCEGDNPPVKVKRLLPSLDEVFSQWDRHKASQRHADTQTDLALVDRLATAIHPIDVPPA